MGEKSSDDGGRRRPDSVEKRADETGQPAGQAAPANRNPRLELLAAAETCLRRDGFANFSTRRIAEQAGMPLSQIHYHFGSKQGLALALLTHLNERLLTRQAAAFAAPMPLSVRWERSCDFLEEDVTSGYVRILQEIIAAGWSDPSIAAAARDVLRGWFELIAGLAEEAVDQFGSASPLEPADIAALVGAAFMGVEEALLLGLESDAVPLRRALRRFGALIRLAEQARG